MTVRKFISFLLLLFMISACKDREEECFECQVVRVQFTQEFGDSVAVYKDEREFGRCAPSKASRDKKEENMKKRAEEQRKYLRAYADPDYDGFYTGKRSIDSEEDLFSMIDKEDPVYPFLIHVGKCEHFSRLDRD